MDVFGKEDGRPQRGMWAPGNYTCKCGECNERFMGDKRAQTCADCAYSKEGESLSDRMKGYESKTKYQFPSDSIIVARIDGRGFSKYTKQMHKPFDAKFTEAMKITTEALVEQTGATIGYTQSDEISLVWHTDNPNGQVFFNGKLQKLCSVCASIATAEFNMEMQTHERGALAMFDCRVFTVPSKEEAVNYLIGRQQDATRNSISMAAHAQFGHKKLMNQSTAVQKDMLMYDAGINWDDYPAANRIGSYFMRRSFPAKVDNPNAGEMVDCIRSQVRNMQIMNVWSFDQLFNMIFGGTNETV